MTFGMALDAARAAANVPLYLIYDALNLDGDAEYKMVVRGQYKLSVYQKIMVFVVFESYRDAMRTLASLTSDSDFSD